MTERPKSFGDYKPDRYQWVTTASAAFYPDYLVNATILYKPVMERFGQLLEAVGTSEELFWQIDAIRQTQLRTQLWRVFRKYVSPATSVEMLKVKQRAKDIVARFGDSFHPIDEVRRAFAFRALPDDTLSAILWEYKDRGQSGYKLTEDFFEYFRLQFPDMVISGPQRAGRDIFLGTVFADYPNPKRPVDFVIREPMSQATHESVLAIGLARYDTDRGGAQEDDRIGGYRECADEVLRYTRSSIENEDDFSQRWPRSSAWFHVGRLCQIGAAMARQSHGDDHAHGT
jgi:hypothetical protein